MKEQQNIGQSSEIKWPAFGKVEVGADVDFTYIIRKDGRFTMDPIAGSIATEYGFDYSRTQQILLEEYDTFVAKLVDIFRWGFISKGNSEVHLFDPNALEKAVMAKSREDSIVSLDPLISRGVSELKVSRAYYMGGKKDISQIARPGNEQLSIQAQKIKETLKGDSVCVVEDDIFSGGSLIASLSSLLEYGIPIKKAITGIQVGKPEKITEMGIVVDPVVTYETTDGKDIFDKVDLGDPRDYLLGGSGLVVKLPSNKYGRSPYILPFVSVSARACVPEDVEKKFSLKVLQANFEFFSSIEKQFQKPVVLGQMNQDFIVLMNSLFGFDRNASMAQIIAWAMNNLDGIWEATVKQGELQEKLSCLELPRDIVLVDVNGTLFSDNSEDGYILKEDIDILMIAVAKAEAKGISVGICSDSPLPQLQKLAERLGIHGLIIAENGSILYNNGLVVVTNSVDDISTYKQQIVKKAEVLGLFQKDDSIAKEFGGNNSQDLKQEWSFGANRSTTVTVFGPPILIQRLGESICPNGISVDCSPEYNYFAIHPGDDFRQSKGNTLSALASYGHNVLMIGNSMSDWVDSSTGVRCSFVASPDVTTEVLKNAFYVSDKPLVKGVVDIINLINK